MAGLGLRQSPDGLLVYSGKGREEITLPKDKSPRDLVIAEFADAIAGKPVTHTGRWGLANLEVCTAAIESSRSGEEVELRHQVPVAFRNPRQSTGGWGTSAPRPRAANGQGVM